MFRLFEVLARNRAFHPSDDEFDAPLDVRHFRRQRRLAQLHTRARFIQKIDRFIRQETIGDVAVREVHRRLDRLIRVVHHMELFVARFNTLQDPHGFVLVRCPDLHGLEAPFQGAVLLDRLAVLGWGCCANALDLAARQCRFKDVRGVERTFRRSGTHQCVQLVDENNRVWIIDKLFHDSFQALIKLTAIFRSSHNQREI